MEFGLRGWGVGAGEELRIAGPAQLDVGEEIGLRPRHREQALGAEFQLLEDLRVRVEGDAGAASVGRRADLGERRFGQSAREGLAVELLAARHLDDELVRQRVDHRDADAVEAAGRLVGLGVEFAARVQRRHDDFERRLVRKARVRLHRDAAPVVDHREEVLGELHLDPGGVAGHGLVHAVVEHFGEEVVEGAVVRAADVHARAAAHRLQAFQHLDVGGGIAAVVGSGGGAGGFRLRRGGGRGGFRRRGRARRGGFLVRSAGLSLAAAEKVLIHPCPLVVGTHYAPAKLHERAACCDGCPQVHPRKGQVVPHRRRYAPRLAPRPAPGASSAGGGRSARRRRAAVPVSVSRWTALWRRKSSPSWPPVRRRCRGGGPRRSRTGRNWRPRCDSGAACGDA